MKVLMVNGSPHKEGCTYTALKEVSGALEKYGIESEIFWVGNGEIAGCIGCGACAKTGEGCFRKDVVNEFVAKAGEADGYIFGSLCCGKWSIDIIYGPCVLQRWQ